MKDYLKKMLSIREKRLRYDFLPSMLEIIERPANKSASIIIWLIVFCFASVIIWAYYYELDIVVTAQGAVVPDNDLIALQSEYGGRIDEIFEDDGSNVKKGDVIFSINQTDNEMDIDKLKYDLDVLRIQQEIYGKIFANMDAEEPEELKSEEYGQFQFIVESMLVEEEIYRTQLEGYELQILRVDEKKDKKIVENERDGFQMQRKLTLLQNLNSLEIQIHSKEMELEEAEYLCTKKIVKSPADGVIIQSQINTAEMLVSSGQTLAFLIPDDAVMIFQAYVKGAEIEQINEGDRVSVKLSAFHDTDYEIVSGMISRVSDVSVFVEGLGNVYQVEVNLDPIENMQELSYRIGMEGTCDIIIGERSVLDYFLEPFKKGFKESLKES